MTYWRTFCQHWTSLSFLDRLSAASHVFVILAAVSSLVFFILERGDARDKSRRETSLQFIALSYGDDVRASKQASNAFILARLKEFSEASQRKEAGLPLNFETPPDTADVFLARLEFYDQILICRDDIQQCDPEIIDAVFRQDMCNFEGYLQIMLSQLEANYGRGIANRLHRYCLAPPSRG